MGKLALPIVAMVYDEARLPRATAESYTKLHSALYLSPRSAPTRALLPGQQPFRTLVVHHHAWSAPRKGAPSRATTYPVIHLIVLRAWSAPRRALLPGQKPLRTAVGIEPSPFPPIVSSGCYSRSRRPLKGPPLS